MPPSEPDRPSGGVPPALRERLRARSGPDGFVPFDRVMDVALYDPTVGYYARTRSPFGPRGDYYTASRVHPLFARTLSRRVAEVASALGYPEPFALVDLGSGDGALAAGIVRALGEQGAVHGLEAVVIDRTPERRSASRAALEAVAGPLGVPFRSAGSLAELGPQRAFVLAHELLDAQPARRLRWDGSSWREVGYRLDGEQLRPAERDLCASVPPPPLPVLGEEDRGVMVEVSPGATALVREVADHLAEGLLVLVDFGDEGTALRSAHPRGTVAAVRAHRALASPEEALGEADLSAFVDFTRVRQAAAAAGLVELAYRSQAEALAAWGFPQELERAVKESRSSEEEVRVRLAAKSLLFGFGTFLVLELAAPASAERLRALSGASPATSP